MNLVKQYEKTLLASVEQYFPKTAKISKNRENALMLFADAMVCIVEVVKAFGGCEFCYGKGYSTTITMTHRGERKNFLPCSCERGKQMQRIFATL